MRRARAAILGIALPGIAVSVVALLLATPARAADLGEWARCMGQAGPATAIEACTAIIKAGKEAPDSLPYAYLYRGRAHAALRQGDLALADYTDTLHFMPPLAHAFYGMGQVYKTRGQWGKAAAAFEKAAASTSEDADIDAFTAEADGSLKALSLSEAGFALFKNGNLKQPMADYEAAIGLCPTCSAPYRNKALLLDALRKPQEALVAADAAIAHNPRSSLAFLIRGVVKAHAGRTAAAIADYDEAIRLYAGYTLPYKARAYAYATLGKSRLAAADKATVIRIDKGAAEPLDPPPPADPQVARAAAAPALGDAKLRALLTAKRWQARQGPWAATLEFRGDGSFRQRSKDMSVGEHLDVVDDGAWGVSRGQICLYTQVGLCMTGHLAGDTFVLARGAGIGGQAASQSGVGVIEYAGATSALEDFAADMTSDPIAPFPIEEELLPAMNHRDGKSDGKGKSKGRSLFYYIHGFEGQAREHSPLPEYFIDEMRSWPGWDVIDADYPRRLDGVVMRFEGSNFGAAVTVARRLKALKAQGYDRIYVGGQSWGGWTTLALATQPGLPLDGVVMIVPACCGWTFGGANADDPNLANNKFYFDQLIKRVRYPTVSVFFRGDEYEPADRGKGAAAALTKNGVANLVIDHPRGFDGHGAAWFPAFDYRYGGCIANFLSATKTGPCRPSAIGRQPGDFRAIVSAKQLLAPLTKTATLSDLRGRRFAVYPDGDLRTIASADKTLVESYGMGESEVNSSFQGDAYCLRMRVKFDQPQTTDPVCTQLVEWSQHELLAIDKASGRVVQWWVERPAASAPASDRR